VTLAKPGADEPAAHAEAEAEAEVSDRDRELLEFLIEVTWAQIRRQHSNLETPEPVPHVGSRGGGRR
jgi:hypothetical protein